MQKQNFRDDLSRVFECEVIQVVSQPRRLRTNAHTDLCDTFRSAQIYFDSWGFRASIIGIGGHSPPYLLAKYLKQEASSQEPLRRHERQSYHQSSARNHCARRTLREDLRSVISGIGNIVAVLS